MLYLKTRQLELLLFAVEDLLLDKYFEAPDEFPEGDYEAIEDMLDQIKRRIA